MFKSLIAAALVATTLFATVSAEAQSYGPAPSPKHYRCTADGQPATPGTGWCKRNDAPTTVVSSTSASPPAQQQQQTMGTPALVRPLSPSEIENLKQVIKGEMMQQSNVAPRKASASAVASQQQQQTVKIIIESPQAKARVEEPKVMVTPPATTPAEPPKPMPGPATLRF